MKRAYQPAGPIAVGTPGEMSLSLPRGSIDACGCLPRNNWKQLSQKLMEATSPFQARSRLVQRRIIAPAQEVEIDKAGRVAVPRAFGNLRVYPGIV